MNTFKIFSYPASHHMDQTNAHWRRVWLCTCTASFRSPNWGNFCFTKLILQLSDSPDDVGVSLGDFMAFVTGTRSPPATGFGSTPTVEFNDEKRYPVASTCLLSLTLSRDIDSYTKFKDMMTTAIVGSHGFGRV